MCKPLVNHVCRVILELLRKKILFLLGAPRPVWTLNLASGKEAQAVGKLGAMKSRISVNKSEVVGETVLRKPDFLLVPPSLVEQNVKRKPEMDRAYQRRHRWNSSPICCVRSNNKMCVTWRLIWPK